MSDELHYKIMMDLVNQPELEEEIEKAINTAYYNISQSVECTLEEWEDAKDARIAALEEEAGVNRETMLESAKIIKELCQCFNIPLPEATLSKLEKTNER